MRAARIAAGALSPAAASVSIRRESVGSEATGPKRPARRAAPRCPQRSPLPGRRPGRGPAGPCRDHARTLRRARAPVTRAAPSSPVRRAVSTSSTPPACETTPAPSPDIRTRGYDPLRLLTWKVPSAPRRPGPSTTPIVAAQRHFPLIWPHAGLLRRESTRLATSPAYRSVGGVPSDVLRCAVNWGGCGLPWES